MTNLDKFYSDADRLMARASVPGALQAAQKYGQELSRLFLVWARDYGNLASDLANYWTVTYSRTLDTPEGRKAGAEWFGSLLSLLGGSFSSEMNFPDRDWEEIRETINAEAENLDMDLLTSILTVIVDRGKA